MSKLDERLGDCFLVEHCQNKRDELTFLTGRTKIILDGIGREADEHNSQTPSPHFLSALTEQLNELWPNLLMDAVHTLKLHDRREKAGAQHFFEESDPRARTDARESNVYGITELKNYYEAFTDYERVLYGTEATYRDHVVHTIRTWLLGVYLLTASTTADITSLHFAPPIQVDDDESQIIKQNRALSEAERWSMWTIVALCHDLGYPLEKTHIINNVIEKMLSYFGHLDSTIKCKISPTP